MKHIEHDGCLGCFYENLPPEKEPCCKCKGGVSPRKEEYKTAKDLYTKERIENVNHPSHYQGKNECIDVMVAMFGVEAVKSFCKCNAYKYRFRAAAKNGAEDIQKAEWYESKLIELEREV